MADKETVRTIASAELIACEPINWGCIIPTIVVAILIAAASVIMFECGNGIYVPEYCKVWLL